MSRFFGKVCQNGYVVRDIEAALKHWTDVLGVGPFFYIDRVKCDWFTYRGEPSPVEMSIALANTGDLQIELIQQRNDSAFDVSRFPECGPRRSAAHVLLDGELPGRLRPGAGRCSYKVGHEGQIGGEQGRFVYFDTETHPGTVIEMSDISGAKGKFFAHIRRAAESWDGTDPIRPVK